MGWICWLAASQQNWMACENSNSILGSCSTLSSFVALVSLESSWAAIAVMNAMARLVGSLSGQAKKVSVRMGGRPMTFACLNGFPSSSNTANSSFCFRVSLKCA